MAASLELGEAWTVTVTVVAGPSAMAGAAMTAGHGEGLPESAGRVTVRTTDVALPEPTELSHRDGTVTVAVDCGAGMAETEETVASVREQELTVSPRMAVVKNDSVEEGAEGPDSVTVRVLVDGVGSSVTVTLSQTVAPAVPEETNGMVSEAVQDEELKKPD